MYLITQFLEDSLYKHKSSGRDIIKGSNIFLKKPKVCNL